MLSRRVLRLLDLLVCLLATLQSSQVLFQTARLSHGAVAVGLLASGVMATTWLAWRMRARRWLLGVLCLATFLSALTSGGSGSGAFTMILGVALASYGFGQATGAGICLLLASLHATLMLVDHRRPGAAVLEVVGTFCVMLLGVLVGEVLRELGAERIRNAELLDEVRRSAGVEQELVLAEERARSARELHDGLGHQLTLVVLSLQYAQRMRGRDPDKAFDEVQQAHRTAQQALAHMRRWVRALNPPREQAVSGNSGFEAIADSFRGTGLEVVVSHEGRERELDRAASLVAVRFVQEGLTNVLRHSAAQRVELHLNWAPDALALVLRDDGGAGSDLTAGFGLRSLSERAAQLGGEVLARNTPAGVELVGLLPLAAGDRKEGQR